MLHAQLPATDVHHLRLPAGDHRNFDTCPGDLFDSVAVPDMELLERFSARSEKQASVRENAIDIQYQHADGGGGFPWHAAQTTPARNRSWMFSAPIRRPCSSATGRAVMRYTSIRCTA